jgi:hypothetical protein
VIRLLTQAAQQGLPVDATLKLGEKLELSPTFQAKLKALLGTVKKAPSAATLSVKPAPMMEDESTTTRLLRRSKEPLDGWRLRRAVAKHVAGELQNRAGDEGFSYNVFEVRSADVETVLGFVELYSGDGFDHDADAHALYWVHETDDEERLWLLAIDRVKGELTQVGGTISPNEIPSRLNEDDFADLFPHAGALDEVETQKFADILIGKARLLKVSEVLS